MQFLTKLKLELEENYHQLILFVPVFFGIGIASYFGLTFEPDYRISCSIILSLCLLFLILYFKIPQAKYLLKYYIIFIIFALLGFLNSQLHTLNIIHNTSEIDRNFMKHTVNVTGKIVEVHDKEKATQLLIKPYIINETTLSPTVKFIRVNLKQKLNLNSGDIIKVPVSLSYPPPPSLPGGYDFKRIAFFQKIGAVGFILGKIEILESQHDMKFNEVVSVIRKQIIQKIYNSISPQDASIATGLLTGERGLINKTDLTNIRNSGLAHLLAISGLHITLVCAIFLFIFRNFLSIFSFISLNYDIKKISAFMAIIGSLIYLILTGMPISGQRAFIMTSIILIGITINKTNTPLRSVAFAAMVILIISPENLLTPSFQMSFAAAIALIAGFNYLQKTNLLSISSQYFILKIFKYMLMTVISSLIAGFATLPFVLYHFQYWSKYGLFANIIAVPLTSLWVMPFGILSLITMPFGLEILPLQAMALGIKIIILVSEYISSIESNISQVPALSTLHLAIITISLLWLVIWQTNVRKYAFIPIAISLFFISLQEQPNLIIDHENKLFALITEDKIYLNKTRHSFKRDYWQQYFALSQSDKLENYKDYQCIETLNPPFIRKYVQKTSHKKPEKWFNCNLKFNNHNIMISSDKENISKECNNYNILIAEHLYSNEIDDNCKNNKLIISKSDLRQNGAHLVYLSDNNIKIKHNKHFTGYRPWS